MWQRAVSGVGARVPRAIDRRTVFDMMAHSIESNRARATSVYCIAIRGNLKAERGVSSSASFVGQSLLPLLTARAGLVYLAPLVPDRANFVIFKVSRFARFGCSLSVSRV